MWPELFEMGSVSMTMQGLENVGSTTNSSDDNQQQFRPHACYVCGKRFKLSHHLKQHYRTHTGERPYVCSVCGRGFSQQSSHMYHYKRCLLISTSDDKNMFNINNTLNDGHINLANFDNDKL